MTDAFSDLVMPIFREVIDLKDRLSWRSDLPGLESVKKQARGWVEAAEQKARADDGLASEFALAKYGFVAWIDEVLTDSTWGQSVGWGSEEHVLEWDLYRTNLRAGRFYDEAEEAYAAVSQSRCSTDPLEVYLLCVALGFLGDLKFNRGRHQEWVERVYSKVSEASPMAAKPFADEPNAASPRVLEPRRGPEVLLRVSALAAITALATLAAYLATVHYSMTVRVAN